MLSKIRPVKGARHRKKRIGRGPGSGHGKTSTRGHKGTGQRAGKKFDARFEGGQMPLYRRIPKRGFTNPMRKEFAIVNLGEIERVKLTGTITFDSLKNAGLVKKNLRIKILAKGEIMTPVTIQAHAISESALLKLEKIGGKFEKIV